MRLTIVRHAQTDGNLKGLFSGSEILLTDLGHEQARSLAERLGQEHFDVVIVSPYARTRQTAAPLLEHHRGQIIFDPRIQEQDFGVFTNRPFEELRLAAEAQGVSRIEFKPENGESVLDMRRRVADFVKDLKEHHIGKNVLVVSHGGTIINILFQLLNHPEERFQELRHNNTGVTRIEYTPDGTHTVIHINNLSHLPSEKHTR